MCEAAVQPWELMSSGTRAAVSQGAGLGRGEDGSDEVLCADRLPKPPLSVTARRRSLS